MSSFLRLAPCIALILCGCDSADQVHLSRCGRLVAQRLEHALEHDGALGDVWRRIHETTDVALDARIMARLHWDKGTADAQVQVKAANGLVELKGRVRDEEQRRRALELAQGTVGVEKVTDSLEISSP